MANEERGSEDRPMTFLPPPPSGTDKPVERSSRASLATAAFGSTAGIGAWALLGAYEESAGGFFVACLLMAVAYGAVAPRSAAPLGAALVLGPVPLAMFTAHQGDGDGLWILVIPLLAVFGLITAGAAAVTGRVIAPRIRSGDPVSRAVSDHLALVCVTSVALSGLLALATMRAYPDPWPELEAVLGQADPPDEFADRGSSRIGSPLQVRGGAPMLQRNLSSSLTPVETCNELQAVLTAWSHGSTVDWEVQPGSTDHLCGGNGSVPYAGTTYRVSASAWTEATGDVRVDLSVRSTDR
jgi:hypothetical protein